MPPARSSQRGADWFGPARARAWLLVLAASMAAMVGGLVLATWFGTGPDPWGRPLGTDFTSFWTAGRLALEGLPEAAWDPARHAAAQAAAFNPASGFGGEYFAFYYPPPFLLLCLPFALLPYAPALALWVAAATSGFVVAVRALLPRCWPRTLVALGFPAVALNAEHGQNGALCAALVSVAAAQLERRPALAGACLGALCVKPQLFSAFPLALLAARRWRALAGCAASVAALCGTSWLAFGAEAWTAAVASAPRAREALEAGLVGFGKMVSTFAALRLLGASGTLAWAGQAVAACVAVAVLGVLCRRRPGAPAEMAIASLAALLMTPFLLDYDLMLLGVPLAVAAHASDRDRVGGERLVLLGAFVLPFLARPMALRLGVPAVPIVVSTLLAMLCIRFGEHPALKRAAGTA